MGRFAVNTFGSTMILTGAFGVTICTLINWAISGFVLRHGHAKYKGISLKTTLLPASLLIPNRSKESRLILLNSSMALNKIRVFYQIRHVRSSSGHSWKSDDHVHIHIHNQQKSSTRILYYPSCLLLLIEVCVYCEIYLYSVTKTLHFLNALARPTAVENSHLTKNHFGRVPVNLRNCHQNSLISLFIRREELRKAKDCDYFLPELWE